MTNDSNFKRYAVTFGPTDKLIEHPGGLWVRFDDAQREIDAAHSRGFAEGSGNEGEYQRDLARLRACWTEALENVAARNQEITQLRGNLSLAEEGKKILHGELAKIDARADSLEEELASATQEIALLRDQRDSNLAKEVAEVERLQGVIATREEALRALNRDMAALQSQWDDMQQGFVEVFGEPVQDAIELLGATERLRSSHEPVAAPEASIIKSFERSPRRIDCGNPVMNPGGITHSPCKQPEGHQGECDPPTEKSDDGPHCPRCGRGYGLHHDMCPMQPL